MLAVEAAKVEQSVREVRVASAEQSLREALGVIGGRLVATTGGPIITVAISSNNRWLVTGSGDKTARLWDKHVRTHLIGEALICPLKIVP